jgi:hypothetical protein
MKAAASSSAFLGSGRVFFLAARMQILSFSAGPPCPQIQKNLDQE